MDKTKTCQYCPDRKVGCHARCPEYLERARINDEKNRERYRLVRRFIAKGERISDYGIDAIARIEDWCHNLPRKILGYKTPDELFEAKLDEIYSA